MSTGRTPGRCSRASGGDRAEARAVAGTAGTDRIMPLLGAVFGLGLLGACSATPDLPRCKVAAGATERLEGYQLGPGDRLRVTVFRHENLSGKFALDATGTVALPLVGEISAGGLTPRELEKKTEQHLQRERYLVSPQVSMEVLTYRPLYVLGEVAQPGEYEYVSGMNVVNAVALAGGYTYRADPSDVTISRGDCFINAEPTTRVLPGEIVQVPERFF